MQRKVEVNTPMTNTHRWQPQKLTPTEFLHTHNKPFRSLLISLTRKSSRHLDLMSTDGTRSSQTADRPTGEASQSLGQTGGVVRDSSNIHGRHFICGPEKELSAEYPVIEHVSWIF
jgi:hypothetical protein